MALQQNNKIMKYDKYSARAEEFINHQEILDTIAYVEANTDNKELQRAIPVSYTHLDVYKRQPALWADSDGSFA